MSQGCHAVDLMFYLAGAEPESVHLCDFPHVDEALRDEALEAEMDAIQVIVSNAHALRKKLKIKVRQPLELSHVIIADEDRLESLEKYAGLIAEELNVPVENIYNRLKRLRRKAMSIKEQE